MRRLLEVDVLFHVGVRKELPKTFRFQETGSINARLLPLNEMISGSSHVLYLPLDNLGIVDIHFFFLHHHNFISREHRKVVHPQPSTP